LQWSDSTPIPADQTKIDPAPPTDHDLARHPGIHFLSCLHLGDMKDIIS